ncbi:gag-polypeptide of LTR copia-type domain-containing protein [Phthorimaea operculella]|nr:gag-polypeptide of LTR copia-type domain-containing protein [Phthorimaea operculella]
MAGSNGNSSLSMPVEKLRGIHDYHNWKFAMRMLLVHEDLWEYVETEEKSKETNKNSMKALAKICLSVHTSAYPHVRNAKTAYEAWKNLKNAYEDKGLCRRLSLLRALFGMKLSECDSMDIYLSKITEIVQQLADIDSKLDDDFVAVLMLSGLPPDYDPLIMAMENTDKTLSSEVVKAKLLQENQRRDDNHTETVTALAVKKILKCFRCKSPGHVMKDCPQKFNKHLNVEGVIYLMEMM